MNCPRCREGELTEKISYESKNDNLGSIILGVALGMGYFSSLKSVRVTEYNCNKCSYQEKKEDN